MAFFFSTKWRKQLLYINSFELKILEHHQNTKQCPLVFSPKVKQIKGHVEWQETKNRRTHIQLISCSSC